MAKLRMNKATPKNGAQKNGAPPLPGQVVLVLQGGGALGAYQAGVYEALHAAGIEPDWVIGTSIGAINGAIVAGNRPAQRLERLRAFWNGVEQNACANASGFGFPAWGNGVVNMMTLATGIPSFFTPNPMAWLGQYALVGIEHAAYYTMAPLRRTLADLVDLDYINGQHTRISLGAVKISSGEMSYFDSSKETITMEHVIASGALPPAFPAVRVNDDFYWDGGLYSNTPIEAVLEDHPRRDSLIFAVDVWNAAGPLPTSLWQVVGREKDIQYASRAQNHIARQKQIHHLRHIILELVKAMPEQTRNSTEIRELAAWGCKTTMHIARIVASASPSDDQMKDIDFTPASILARWQAGYADTQRMLERAPWTLPVDPMEGLIIHDNLPMPTSLDVVSQNQ